jgi:tetrahydromethanopterin S-methyltransferase subunit A
MIMNSESGPSNNIKEWPPVSGRYYLGNKNSAVAVCTLASIDMLENFNEPRYLEKVAIVGKIVTENVGIEKIVQNVISNPNIRYLLLCGKESKGHYVGQSLKALVSDGVHEGRIVGAKGPMPLVKNLSKDEIDTFRRQIEIVDLIGCEDIDEVLHFVDECNKNKPKPFRSKVEISRVETIDADYDPEKSFTADEQKDKGWFAISINRPKKLIVVDYYVGYGTDSKLNCRIVGTTAESIAGSAVKRKLLTTPYHGSYLGKELAKAEIALKHNLPYEQESELNLSKLKEKKD